MKNLINSLVAAIVGGLVVFGAITYYEVPEARVIERVVTKAPKTASRVTDGNTLSAQEIYESYGGAVVHVQATVTSTYEDFFGIPRPENRVASGSGFIVSKEGYAITNAHVVSGADDIVVTFSDRGTTKAELIGIDLSTDLAFLKLSLKNRDYKVLSLGDSKNVKVGSTVYAIGNPLGYDRSMSSGIISALNREIEAPNNFAIRGVIQTDAAINQGNSGGPLLSSSGEVIGVTSQIATTGQGNIGIAFAIPSATVKKIFSEIKENGKASHPWLGIRGATLLPEVAEKLKLKVKRGAMVVSTVDPGPAKKAGLKGANKTIEIDDESFQVGGDIITEINGTKTTSMEDLVNQISGLQTGDKAKLKILRDNKLKVVEVRLEEWPEQNQFFLR